VAVLDPDVVLRADQGAAAGGSRRVRGAATVANQSMTFQRLATGDFSVRPALVNGAAGLVAYKGGRVYSVLGFTVAGGRIVEIDILADPDRLARLDLTGRSANRRPGWKRNSRSTGPERPRRSRTRP
jgi:hypothetical protein